MIIGFNELLSAECVASSVSFNRCITVGNWI